MGACTSTSRVSDEALTALPNSALPLPAPLAVEVVKNPLSNGGVPLAADVGKDKAATERVSALLPAKDGSELVGVGAMPSAADAGKSKAFTQCVRALVPAAVLPPRSGQHAYRLLGELAAAGPGGSAYGAVRLMQHRRTGELVTTRWIDYMQGVALSRSDEREIVNHRRLGHPHVLGFREVYLARPDPKQASAPAGDCHHLVVVTEHANGGTLGDRVEAEGPFSEADAQRLFRQLCDGLAHCHSCGMVHRALSVDTLVLTGSAYAPHLKIAGFGMSKSAIEESMPKTRMASGAVYTPPELLAAGYGGPDPYDGAACDAWACGVCLYYMLVGRLPFVEDGAVVTRRDLARIATARYELPPQLGLSAECTDLLARLLVADPKQRFRVSDMQRHPWLAWHGAGLAWPAAAAAEHQASALSVPKSDLPQSEEDLLATVAAARRASRRRRLTVPRSAPTSPTLVPAAQGSSAQPGGLVLETPSPTLEGLAAGPGSLALEAGRADDAILQPTLGGSAVRPSSPALDASGEEGGCAAPRAAKHCSPSGANSAPKTSARAEGLRDVASGRRAVVNSPTLGYSSTRLGSAQSPGPTTPDAAGNRQGARANRPPSSTDSSPCQTPNTGRSSPPAGESAELAEARDDAASLESGTAAWAANRLCTAKERLALERSRARAAVRRGRGVGGGV